eukprot:CAMPEP_0184693712 /NCGR_PEP_ID=MMETSP0313-20130426/1875_1 /TAXON_ID=2792 /ORGANISM="Porphyridium aerugineum, Strain SAG 1380-2" /LENGTH=543 /DNA_ID=CAMNT_0027151857 /DNA_START=85 /DNA_END=1716 /DNA_ORIENTATION=-
MVAENLSADKDLLQFTGVLLAGLASGEGTLKIAPSGFAWKAREGVRMIAINKLDIVRLFWLRGGRSQQLRIICKGQVTHRFEGFREADFDSIQSFVSRHELIGGTGDHGDQRVEVLDQAACGWSWGTCQVEGASMEFRNDRGEEVFELPLSHVAQVNMSSKHEIALEFHVDDTAAVMDECLTEMRLAIADDVETDALIEAIKEKADTSAFAGESIVSFKDMPVIVPRGRYEVDMFPNHLKLHGKSVDYKILYSSVARLFLLPKPDDVHVAFVLSLDPPIRQGNTHYHHLVFQMQNDQQTEVTLNLSEKDRKEKYDKLELHESGELWRVFSKVVRHISKKPLHVSKTFSSKHNQRAVRTALGPNEGYVFFLESCMFFLNKPPTYIRFDDVDLVEFKRMDNNRSFDLSVTLNNGQVTVFSNIDRGEFEVIRDFLEAHKVPMDGHLETGVGKKGELAKGGKMKGVGGMELDDDEDEDEEDEEDDDFNPELEVKQRKEKKGKSGKKGGSDDEDDDDEEDAMDDDELDEAYENEAVSDDDTRPKKKKK